ncbi:hypothetical protein CDL15_Pgr005194 [Punica granatum]|uniref:Uncharacterized protein n=1 Tax=Punica granatum TaxID=22663 RepID=A0A218WP61_PUNGR|nr:hypothetical protein CDL15_Pgr005194 [Punica granatum]
MCDGFIKQINSDCKTKVKINFDSNMRRAATQGKAKSHRQDLNMILRFGLYTDQDCRIVNLRTSRQNTTPFLSIGPCPTDILHVNWGSASIDHVGPQSSRAFSGLLFSFRTTCKTSKERQGEPKNNMQALTYRNRIDRTYSTSSIR